VSLSCFELARLLDTVLTLIFLQSVILEKGYMKLNVGKVVDIMTQESCIPTDSVKSGDDDFNFVH